MDDIDAGDGAGHDHPDAGSRARRGEEGDADREQSHPRMHERPRERQGGDVRDAAKELVDGNPPRADNGGMKSRRQLVGEKLRQDEGAEERGLRRRVLQPQPHDLVDLDDERKRRAGDEQPGELAHAEDESHHARAIAGAVGRHDGWRKRTGKRGRKRVGPAREARGDCHRGVLGGPHHQVDEDLHAAHA